MNRRLAIALLLTGVPSALRAHSFYPPECCSDTDCWPMGQDRDAKEPDPRVVPGGYLTHDGIFVPEANTRISPDGRYHICRRSGSLSGDIIKPTGQPTCLWVPGRGT